MSDSEMRKALQEREQDFLKNMAWLDEDLDRRIREEDEKQRRYEDNLTWLDEDLNTKLDQRHRENVAWLDEDLNTKLDQRHQENIAWLDEDLDTKLDERKRGLLQEIQTSSTMTETQPQRTPKIWHCGHGAKWGRTDSKVEKERMMKRHDEGIREGTCFIHTAHLNEGSLKKRGNDTTKQFKKFLEGSQEGDHRIHIMCKERRPNTLWLLHRRSHAKRSSR